MTDIAPVATHDRDAEQRRRFWRSWVGPGSVSWLLRHDLRLASRGMRATDARGTKVAATVLGLTVVLLHLIGFAAAPALTLLHDRFRADAMLTGSIALACVFALFLSKSMLKAGTP